MKSKVRLHTSADGVCYLGSQKVVKFKMIKQYNSFYDIVNSNMAVVYQLVKERGDNFYTLSNFDGFVDTFKTIADFKKSSYWR